MPPVVAVVGPTASGKSELGVSLALALRTPGNGLGCPGEVVNADSMQLYRGASLGTAKLTEVEQRGVPHHLLDVWHVTETANVAAYQRLARQVLDELRRKGRTPIVVGGSGLYVRACLDQLDFPTTDPAIRQRLEAELAASGPAPLHARLAQFDPAAATAILPANGRRIVRALEVIEITGQPFTARLPSHQYVYPAVQIGLQIPRADLDERITRRVDRMWAVGLVDEVRKLEAAGLRRGLTASRALGYAQLLRFLAGEWTEEQARAETIRATKRFARRQESWFRRDPRVHWLAYDRPDLLQEALAVVSEHHATLGAVSAQP